MEQAILFSKIKKGKRPKGQKRKKNEEKIQLAVCGYLSMQYPNVVFCCDLASGLKLPIHLAARHKRMRSEKGIPDITIYASRGDYKALLLELKANDSGVFLKDGSLSNSKHIISQRTVHEKLQKEGYKVEFVEGFDHAKSVIDEYMMLKKHQ
jgi:hypothetical protein